MNRFAVTLVLANISLFSAESLTDRISILEEKMADVRTQTVYGNYGANTAKAFPNLNSYGVSIWADAVVYKFFVGGTDYVYTDTEASATLFSGTLNDLNFNWAWGFKVGLGYQIGQLPGWQIWSEYTRFVTDESSTTARPTGGALFPNYQNTLLTAYSSTTTHWDAHYNVVDLDFGRNYFLRGNFSVFPRFGVRGAWILQNQTASAPHATAGTLSTTAHTDFRGVGILGGTQARWNFNKNWSFFGDFGASLIWGEVDVSLDTTQSPGEQTPLTVKYSDADLHRILPNMSWESGLRWEMPLISNRTNLSFELSYEFAYWWRINQELRGKSTNSALFGRVSEDLGLNGVKISGAFDF